MRLNEVKERSQATHHCIDCQQDLDPRQIAYHEEFGHVVVNLPQVVKGKENSPWSVQGLPSLSTS